jgi:oxalate---CoA ligase
MDESGLFSTRDLIFHGNQDPDHPAIESPGYQPLTYRDLRNQIIFVVKTLNAMGFHRNDRIAVITPAGPETAVIIISVMAGFTCVPLNPEDKKQIFEDYFSQLKVKAIIVQKGHETAAKEVGTSRNIPIIELIPGFDKAGTFNLLPTVGNIQEAEFATPSDISHILLTSGTTSRPKIVPVGQKQSFLSRQRNYPPLKISPADRCLHIVPYYHAAGIGAPLLSVLLAGGTVICTKKFIPSDFLSLLKTYRPSFYSAGPALHWGILREIKKVNPDELKNNSLRFIRSGSAPLSPTIVNELETLLGVPVINTYASSETGPITVNYPPKPGSVGKPVIDFLTIIQENGKSLGPYEQGEIVVKGETVFCGYENAPDENKAAFIDGWFRTGDMGYLDGEGYLFITGRKKELINRGGEKISPAEIDQVLMTHPAVHQAMTFRIDDPVLGEDVAALVVADHKKISQEDLHTYLLDRLIQFKVPRRIYFVDDIPKSPTGKLLRHVGTERYASGMYENTRIPAVTRDSVSPELTENQEKLLQIWKDILDIPSFSLDDDFFRCGGNSLTAIELLIKIQRAFHITFPPDMIYLHPTIRQQEVLIAQKAGNAAPHYHPLIVPLHQNGTLSPLFCFHPLGGWIKEYLYISQFFDQDRPVFGIRARGLEPAEKPVQTIEEAVREYIDAIKTVRKEGPYDLLGFSTGALYAFECACQLQKRGESVTFLGIIDMSLPAPLKKLFNLKREQGRNILMRTGYPLYTSMNNHLKKNPDTFLYFIFVNGIRLFSQGLLFINGSHALPASESNAEFIPDAQGRWISSLPEQQQMLVRTQNRAIGIYKPGTFSGDITLFSTGPDSEFYPGDPARGWNSCITGKTIIIVIPGDHESLHTDPLGQVVAKKIEESLKRTDAHG